MTTLRLSVLVALGPVLGCSATITGDDPAGPDDPPAASADAGAACAQAQVVLTPTTPTVQLLVDRSGTMNRDFGAQSRWDAVFSTLMDGTTGVVAQLEGQVRFGLTTYSGADGVTPCPILDTVAPALGNYDAIATRYAGQDPIEDTPTAPSIDAVRTLLAGVAEPGPRVIVLATDGEPDTCAVPDPDGEPAARAAAVGAAQAAHAAGVDLYVISVGNEVSAAHLQDMANAGVGLAVGGPVSAPFYRALAADQLVAAFDSIITGVRSCTFALNGSADPARADQGRVTLDGTALEYGVTWRLADGQTLELLGAACDAIQAGGEHVVDAEFTCGGFDVE